MDRDHLVRKDEAKLLIKLDANSYLSCLDRNKTVAVS